MHIMKQGARVSEQKIGVHIKDPENRYATKR